MGHTRHHAIIVTSSIDEYMTAAFDKAKSIFGDQAVMVPAMINKYRTIFIPPDGSNEGWDLSDEWNKKRADFILWLEKQRYEDGSDRYDWVEIEYGGDDKEMIMIRHSR